MIWALETHGAAREGAGRKGDGRTLAPWVGLGFGFAFYGLLLHWVPLTLSGMITAGAVVGVLALLILVGVAGLQVTALGAILRSGAAPAVVALPVVWGATEFLLARAGPLAFPWTPLGLALAPVPALAAPAEVGGVTLLTLWICAVNGWIAGGWRRVGAPAFAAVLVALTLVPGAWSLHRSDRLAEEAVGPVGVVQLALDRNDLLDPETRNRRAGGALEGILAGPTPGDAAFLLLPEAPLAAFWEEGAGELFREHARRVGLPLVVGSRFRDGGRARNGVFLVDGSGVERHRHGKIRLVPGTEWPGTAPGPDGGAFEVPAAGAAGPGETGLRLGALICFESAFGSRSRALVRDGAGLLVNPTIDAWFRPALREGAGAGHVQHRAHLVLRAVETRRGALRSPVGGELLAVDPSGRLREHRRPGEEGLLAVRPRTTEIRTPFVRFGDAGGAAALLALVVLLALPLRRRGTGPEGK